MAKTKREELKFIIPVAAASGMIGYIYLTPPVSQSSLAAGLMNTSLEPALEMYVQRFLLSFLLFAVVPFAAARVCGYRLRDLGLKKPDLRFAPVWMLSAAAAGAVVGFLGIFSPALAAYYPYYEGLAAAVERYGAWVFLAHAAAYFLFYYVPWELLFRGVLLFPLLDAPIERAMPEGRTLFLATIQVIPSSLLHFGHPAAETAGAVLFGFLAGWVTVKTRSILPALCFHAAAGIFLDLGLVLWAGNV